LIDELETLAFGQALELQWKYQKICPSAKQYLVMIDNKTGGFFRLILRLLEVEAQSEPVPELMHLFTLLGRYYQIRDDYMNLASDEVPPRFTYLCGSVLMEIVHREKRLLRRPLRRQILLPTPASLAA
jgi:hypothetical protein